ncbi:MAG: SDR family oxidoreductase, partial [Pseudomonadota bacterium]|nr:SDR family oxidoreductase [Pseudomonadota bacterium]
GYGRIINVISTSVYEPIPNLGVSNTTRAAVAGWAKTLARELGPEAITVNNVLPGFTETGRIAQIVGNEMQKTGNDEASVRQRMTSAVPLGRFAKPDETASLIAFLASPAAGYISGQSIAVDGGRMNSI